MPITLARMGVSFAAMAITAARRGISKSAALLRRMMAAGRSRYEPDPINALSRVEAGRAR
jgi:hypothetical protein